MSRPGPQLDEPPPLAAVPPARALPRLLAGAHAQEAMGLEEHLAAHGALPLEARRKRRSESPLIGQIERAGLRGRGGAGFPTATKLRAVAGARRRAVVVMLDGAQLAAQAVGADVVLVCVCESASASAESLAAAIEERRGLPGESAAMYLRSIPSGYVAGQESALVNHLNGGPAVPTFTPPMPFQQGVRRRPTLISNAETLAQLALVARHGSQWFRELGTPSQAGSALITLSGPVAYPGVYEIEYGASLASLIDAAGGTSARIRAVLFGGYAGAWVDGRLLGGLVLSDEHLAAHGASLGAGVVLLLSEDACPVAETAMVARWLAGESSGQCGPCLNGLDALASTVQELAAGAAQGDSAKRIDRLASLVRRRGACGHPDGAVKFILSALEVFAAEFADHARHGRCDRCSGQAELPIPISSRADARRSQVVSL